MTQNSDLPESQRGRAPFAPTRWSVVLAAADRQSPSARDALQALCETYWYPLYAWARRSGKSADDAAELTQEFFARLLENQLLDRADPQRGRFRSYLLTAFKRFLINEYDRTQAARRGGGRMPISIDVGVGEQRYAFEPADNWTPEAIFERRWALTLLERTLARLQQEYEDRSRGELFRLCRGHLAAGEQAASCREIAAQFRITEAAVRVAIHRMKTRYRELLAEEVSATIDENDSIVEEMKGLQRAIQGKIERK